MGKTKALVEKYFGTLPSGPKPEKPQVAPVKLTSETVIHHEEQIGTLPMVTLAWHSPPYLTQGDAAADVLVTVLAFGKASRLYKRLVVDKQLAQSVDANQQSQGSQSVFLIEVVARPGVSTGALKTEVDAVLEELRVAAGTPDQYALELATRVFGGFFGSRLNMNLREAKGYTYGAGAASDARLGVGPLNADSQVRANVTGPAVTEFVHELTDIKTRPITSQELESARESLIRSLPGVFETGASVGANAASLFFKRLPLDEFSRQVAGLEKATPAEVQRVAEAYFNPAVTQIILVGDPDIIQNQVGPLNLGKLVPVDVLVKPQTSRE